ncbi:focadhesin-like isoform X2 [Acipenser ruthenus]|uniref:focadhesin-like isoform X2 n=1 Tax=Acipenser ruthenus TaxID=7906 RepID=UPI002741AC50|nr:focadhesin-like isoform X2 [Acipenser ruthenus]
MQGNSILALTGLAVAITNYENSLPSDVESTQEKSYSGENTASAIARSCAALALSLMVPLLITSHKESIEEILNTLTAVLPGKPHADKSQAEQFHTGLALGMFLSCFNEERVSTGCILGVGLVLSLMSQNSQTESRVHVAVTMDKLLDSLEESSNQGRMLQVPSPSPWSWWIKCPVISVREACFNIQSRCRNPAILH